MRLRSLLSACLLILSVCGAAFSQTNSARTYPEHLTQTELGEHNLEPPSVIRPASTTMWRNYVTVPDGPCGHPMAVQADCYNPTTRPCGPLHPICFSKRVGRMLDCLIPCNLCCSGGCHGGGIGGRTWGHCSMCCGGGGACGGGCSGWGGAGPACGGGSCNSGCCANPAGSVFDSVPCCTIGGHCVGCSKTTYGCSDATAPPMLNDPFQDDPVPAPRQTMKPPKPTPTPANEVRQTPTNRTRPVSTPAKSNMAQVAPAPVVSKQSVAAKPVATKSNTTRSVVTKSSQPQSVPARGSSAMAAAQPNKSAAMSPYKIVSPTNTKPAAATSQPTTTRRQATVTQTNEDTRSVTSASVLKRASAEANVAETFEEPAPHTINHARTMPITSAPIPSYYDNSAPSNPLR